MQVPIRLMGLDTLKSIREDAQRYLRGCYACDHKSQAQTLVDLINEEFGE